MWEKKQCIYSKDKDYFCPHLASNLVRQVVRNEIIMNYVITNCEKRAAEKELELSEIITRGPHFHGRIKADFSEELSIKLRSKG